MVLELLQTSPYLTVVLPGQPSPIVYAIDELEPLRPPLTAPPGAAFGVLGLDRQVVWHTDPVALDVLNRAAPQPILSEALSATYGDVVVTDLVRRSWLQSPDQLCKDYLITSAQIETTAHCNWGCTCCPVAEDPKPQETMSLELFQEIIDKISVHPTLRYVTFHFYGEPTLDCFFNERVAILAKHAIRLRLFTNASGLTASKLEALKRAAILDTLTINFPALSEEEFRHLTQAKTYAQSLRNLEAAIELGLPVTIVVNGLGDDVVRRVDELRARYLARGVRVSSSLLSDRAGVVANQYYQAIRVKGRLRGCGWPVNHAHFSVKGDVFICCNDYQQREVFGNIRAGTLHEIMASPAAQLIRRRVFGIAEAPDDYLCRKCHDQRRDFPLRQFRPLASFPAQCDQFGRGNRHA